MDSSGDLEEKIQLEDSQDDEGESGPAFFGKQCVIGDGKDEKKVAGDPGKKKKARQA
jgi:hypothetical protein